MLRSFQVIKDPIDYRIINLLDKRRLSDDELQGILNIPIVEIRKHLKALQQSSFISCELTEPINTWRINDSFMEKNSLFYQIAILQMQKAPLYQEDLMHLEALK